MITITQGDDATLALQAENGQGAPHNLTGATFESRINKADGTVGVYPNDSHTITSAANGTFTLVLTAAETALLKLGAGQKIITRITQSSLTTSFHGDKALTVQSVNP